MEAENDLFFTSASWHGKAICDGVEVRDDGTGQGVGLFSTKWFQKNDEICRDMPMAFLHNYSSSELSPSCLNCGRDVLSLEDALACAIKRRRRSLPHFSGIGESGLLQDVALQLPPPLQCPNLCGTLFCSEACRETQLSVGHHRTLCRNRLDPDRLAAWEEFCRHARRNHEAFVLAAYVIVEGILCVVDGRSTIFDAFARYSQFHSRPWHEQVPQSAPDRQARSRLKLAKLEESFELLKKAVDFCGCGSLVDISYYSNLVGMFDLTCVDVGRPHYLEAPLKAKLEKFSGDVRSDFWDLAAEWWICQEQLERDCCTSEEETSDNSSDEGLEKERSLLPPFEGLGFSYKLALTNHSCFPNILIEQESSCEISLKALRNIPPGQQLMMSYIQLESSCAARQKKLFDDYGFKCLCVRCRGDAAYEIRKGNRPVGLEGPITWLENYAASKCLPIDEVANDICSNLPKELRPSNIDVQDSETCEDDGSSAGDGNEDEHGEAINCKHVSRHTRGDGTSKDTKSCAGVQRSNVVLEIDCFLERFSELVAQRDFDAARTLCQTRLQANPNDRYGLQLQQTLLEFNAKEDGLLRSSPGNECAISLVDQEHRATLACDLAFEAMFKFLTSEDRLWYMGEQAIGIFLDPGQNMQQGPQREKVLEMARELLEALLERLKLEGRAGGTMPAGSCVAEGLEEGIEWLFEALGQLRCRRILGLHCPSWLVDGCREEWDASCGSMQTLVGFSAASLPTASLGELCDLLCCVYILEQSLVCNFFGDSHAPTCRLEYGIEVVLAEISSRPLVEAPLEGFFECFYLMTHVVYALNGFNACLPNKREDCPWVYKYIERSLVFWLQEVNQMNSTWASEAVDAIAEAVDCLLGLEEYKETTAIRKGVQFLLTSQDADGFFYSPGFERHGADIYDHIHPSWTAVAALQFVRKPSQSCHATVWQDHIRTVVKRSNFCRHTVRAR